MKIIFTISILIIIMDASAQLQPVNSGAFHRSELPVKKGNQREGRKIAEGTTHEFAYFEMHTTTQEKDAAPAAPHTQQDIEEVIIVTEGTLQCDIDGQTKVIGPGGVMLIPPLASQAFKNIGDGPLTYYVFMFRSKKPMDMERSNKAGGVLLLNADSLELKKTARGSSRSYFNRPTAMCENFEMHVTTLAQKGPSHTPHQHVDTEIILVTEGQTTMTIDGKNYTAGPGDLYIMESGSLHGVSNATDKPCTYFAFKWR